MLTSREASGLEGEGCGEDIVVEEGWVGNFVVLVMDLELDFLPEARGFVFCFWAQSSKGFVNAQCRLVDSSSMPSSCLFTIARCVGQRAEQLSHYDGLGDGFGLDSKKLHAESDTRGNPVDSKPGVFTGRPFED